MRIHPIGLLIPTLAACVLSAALVPSARAQGSGSNRTAPPGGRQPSSPPAQARPSAPRPPTTEEFAQSLWAFLVRAKSPYTQWPALPAKEGLRSVTGSHGPFVRLYANPVALADSKGLPPGSILILEDYTADQKARTAINIAYRVKGFDPKNGDWYWMKYLENGTLVRTLPGEGSVPMAGRVSGCIACHSKAGDNDFVFSNDATGKAAEKPEPNAEEKQNGESPPKREGEKTEGKKDDEGSANSKGPKTLVGFDWPASDRVAIDAIDHRPWDALLKRHVDANGGVDYAAWKGAPDDVRALGSYLDALARADGDRSAARAARLAYWINAYNALTVWGILREYPADRTAAGSGHDVGPELCLRVGDTSFSLGQIENEILRKLNEPRIHFAIVCGARGCPRLLNEGYTPSELEEQLTRNARAFFADRTKFDYDRSRNQVQMSAILDWYADDFGTNTTERLRTIAPYLPDAAAKRLAEDGVASVFYKDYDWGLNDRPSQDAKPGSPGSSADGGR